MIDTRIQGILERGMNAEPLSKAEVVCLLEAPEASAEAAFIRAAGFSVSQHKFSSRGMLLGQIGIESGPCPGRCAFCNFNEKAFGEKASRMDRDEILSRTRAFSGSGGLYALFLMGMHDFDFGFFLDSVRRVRALLPATTNVVVNIGDFDPVQAAELKAAGADGAYHVVRLREGIDTALNPENRYRTIEAIRTVGLDWYTCCEPVGPEHSPDELCEQMFLGAELGCFQHAAMRRVGLPGLPLARKGQISELRLGQITAVISLLMASCKETISIAVHEPNPIGIASGANCVYAESGCNPRDTAADTTVNRGRDTESCRQMLYEAGWSRLLLADGSVVDNVFNQ